MALLSIDGLVVSPSASVRDAIATIDASGRQIALVVDNDGLLHGVVTDGDIRRGILRGVDLASSVADIMNASPTVAHASDSPDGIIALMSELVIRHIPVLDDAQRVIGVFTGGELSVSPVLSTPVVLMAGGRGQRLYPLTKDTPKPMLPIGDVPMLEIILRNLAAQGFVNIYISVNYLADVIIDHVGDGKRLGLNVTYLREEAPLGTAGALAQLNGVISEPLIVMNSDLLTDVNLRRLLAFHLKQQAKATVGVREYLFEIPFGVVDLDGPYVKSMLEKPTHRSLVNAGIYALDSSALSLLPANSYCDMPTLLSLLMESGDPVSAFPIHEQWLDVGRPEDLTRAQSNSAHWAQLPD